MISSETHTRPDTEPSSSECRLGPINGAEIVSNPTLHGCPSFGVDKPFYVVVHGEMPFEYEHYGVHLGQEDRLTFVGPRDRVIDCSLLDCRRNSSTFGHRAAFERRPDNGASLRIPQGVAHTFNGLEDIYTINDYHLFLPRLEHLIDGSSQWSIENDVLNLPLGIEQPPELAINEEPAGDLLYRALDHHHARRSNEEGVRYPVVLDIDVANTRQRVRLTPLYDSAPNMAPTIGRWRRHRFIASGEYSGVVVFQQRVALLLTEREDVAQIMHEMGWVEAGITFLTTKINGATLNAQALSPNPVHELLVTATDRITFPREGAILLRAAADDNQM